MNVTCTLQISSSEMRLLNQLMATGWGSLDRLEEKAAWVQRHYDLAAADRKTHFFQWDLPAKRIHFFTY